MLHARHCITQKSETTLVSFAYRIRVCSYLLIQRHRRPNRTSCRHVLELKRIYQIRYAKTQRLRRFFKIVCKITAFF